MWTVSSYLFATAAITLLLPIASICQTTEQTYYVTPRDNEPCLEKVTPCFTLTEYATKPRGYFESSVILVLLPGNHSLNANFSMQGYKSIDIISSNTSNSSDAITCTNFSRFSFRNISSVQFTGLFLSSCGGNSMAEIDDFTLENCTITGSGYNSSGTGLNLTQVITANITECSFESNKGSIATAVRNEVAVIGGAIVSIDSNIYISRTTFERNTASLGGAIYVVGNNYTIVIKNCTFRDNEIQGSPIHDHSYDGGAVFISESSTEIADSFFISNRATIMGSGGGGVAIRVSAATENTANVNINNCVFHNNSADHEGGGLQLKTVVKRLKVFRVENCTFSHNTCYNGAGAFLRFSVTPPIELQSIMTVFSNSQFSNNIARNDGGGLMYNLANNRDPSYLLVVHKCDWLNNVAGKNGGGIKILMEGFVNISSSTFSDNISPYGGACSLIIYSGVVTFVDTTFNHNHGNVTGGAIFTSSNAGIFGEPHILNLTRSVFEHNTAPTGSAISLDPHCSLVSFRSLALNENAASTQQGVVYVFQSSAFFYGHFTFTNNRGSFVSVSSNVTFSGETSFVNNTSHGIPSNGAQKLQSGGALTGLLSDIKFIGINHNDITFVNNTAQYGGSIFIMESRLTRFLSNFDSENVTLKIVESKASKFGGGIYALQSELNILNIGDVILNGNTAGVKGGAIYMSSSILKLHGGNLQITNNSGSYGGGVCLEAYSKLYVIKDFRFNDPQNPVKPLTMEFSNNTGLYGGAVYISDETNSLICGRNTSENIDANGDTCFIQTLALYPPPTGIYKHDFHLNNFEFFNNTAVHSGGTIYGGLLDRCQVSLLAEVYLNSTNQQDIAINGISYLLTISNFQTEDISGNITSRPVRVCFCSNGKPDCSQKPPMKLVKQRQQFTISVAAVDQVNNSIPAIIVSSLSSQKSVLSQGQSQNVSHMCTDLNYTISSSEEYEELMLYAVGPCGSSGISTQHFNVKFLPCDYCPIGFKADNDCICNCAPEINQFVYNCSIVSETLLVKDHVWINYTNESGYVGYQCTFDYCIQSPVSVNLNLPSGSDIQCGFNRSGVLCGECSDNLSLLLGSSRCMPCSNNWILLIIPFAFAGVLLILFILACNLTVAVGTINGLIFYANIVKANDSIFLPGTIRGNTVLWTQNPLTVFISWINFDLGIETCFYNGMTAYVDTWLQFVFPLYIIFLVILIMKISRHSPNFSRLLTSNPVATLSTLILLSYTKVLRAIIDALSLATPQFSGNPTDNSTAHTTPYFRKVWLIDANIEYLEGKHIALFILAVFLLMVGLVYTFLLLSWQWLYPLLSKSQCFSTSTLIRNTNHFMDAYHAPFKPKHRYWAGVLLLVRAILYFVSALNVLGNPRVNLLAIIIVMGIFYMFQTIVGSNIYKHWGLNVLETSFYVNLFFLASITFFISDLNSNVQYTNKIQSAVGYTSTSIALVTFIGIIIYHTHTFVYKKCCSNRKGQSVHYTPININGSDRPTTAVIYSKRNLLREPLDMISEDPKTEDYQQPTPERDPLLRESERRQGPTFTEIKGLP